MEGLPKLDQRQGLADEIMTGRHPRRQRVLPAKNSSAGVRRRGTGCGKAGLMAAGWFTPHQGPKSAGHARRYRVRVRSSAVAVARRVKWKGGTPGTRSAHTVLWRLLDEALLHQHVVVVLSLGVLVLRPFGGAA